MRCSIMLVSLCLCLTAQAAPPVEVEVELVSLPVAKALAVQRSKRVLDERPLTTHAMEAELLPDGRVRTRCAPMRPDLRQWPQRPGREQAE